MIPQGRTGLLAVVLLVAGACGPGAPAASPVSTPPGVRPSAAPVASADTLADVRRFRSARHAAPVAAPLAVHIPAIDVHSDLQRLGLNDDGTIRVPDRWDRAGWYGEGPRPGQVGPAVVLGHVDSREGPAVFHRLRELRRGDEIMIDRRDGTRITFVVRRVERHAKTRFPTDHVYLPTMQPTLRLVTCTGVFDPVTRHYRDNLVVFADLA